MNIVNPFYFTENQRKKIDKKKIRILPKTQTVINLSQGTSILLETRIGEMVEEVQVMIGEMAEEVTRMGFMIGRLVMGITPLIIGTRTGGRGTIIIKTVG